MPSLVLPFTHRVGSGAGVLTDVTSAVLSDPTGAFGVKRTDTGEVLVADGTPMPRTGTGQYAYTLADPPVAPLTYYVEWVYNGDTNRVPFTHPGLTEDVGGGEASPTTEITFDDPEGFPLSGATLARLTRLDTLAEIALPAEPDFAWDVQQEQWTVDVEIPAGAKVRWKATVTYVAGGTATASGTVVGASDPRQQSGTYWTWSGVQNEAGSNATVYSNLDNLNTSADLNRVAADGAIVDARVNRRFRNAGYQTPIAADSQDSLEIRRAANLLLLGLLIGHRELFEIPADQREAYQNVKWKQGDDLLTELIEDGIDAPKDDDPETAGILEAQESLAPMGGDVTCGCEYRG